MRNDGERFCVGGGILCRCFDGRAGVAQNVSPAMYSGMQWRLIGPFRGGRTVSVSGVPGRRNHVTSLERWMAACGRPQCRGYVGAAVRRATDCVDRRSGRGALESAGDLCGHGRVGYSHRPVFGRWGLQSADGGKTWTNVGLRETRQISRIVVDPKNADVVYVGALGHAYGPNPERGVYKSTDGGKTWTHVLDQGPEIGVSDLAMAAGNPETLFAGTWQAHRPPWSVYAPLEGGKSGMFPHH